MKEIASLFLICFSCAVFGQDDTVLHEDEVKGVQVKTDFTLILRGDVGLYVELPIMNQGLRLETGVGVTTQDFLGELNDGNSILNREVYQVNRGGGFSGRLGVKYYTSVKTVVPTKYFVGLEYRYTDYKTTLVRISNVELNRKLKRTYNDVRLLFGWINYLDEKLFIEFYTGFGIRSKVVDKVIKQYTFLDIEPQEFDGIERVKNNGLNIAGGIKLGILF